MSVVVDTMVFAYALMGHPQFCVDAAAVLKRTGGKIWVPDSVRAEFANVAWQYVRDGMIKAVDVEHILQDANESFVNVVSTDELWERAVELAIERKHPVYDALFAALAEDRDIYVVTFDRPFCKKFPDLTISAEDFLA